MNKNDYVWEHNYHYEKMNTNDSRIQKILNRYGEEGWELVQVLVGSGAQENNAKIHGFVFKRVKMLN